MGGPRQGPGSVHTLATLCHLAKLVPMACLLDRLATVELLGLATCGSLCQCQCHVYAGEVLSVFVNDCQNYFYLVSM